MATLIQAITQYRPRVRNSKTVDLDVLAARLSRGSLVTRSIARMVLEDLFDEVITALREGNAVVLPGIGRFGSSLSLDGRMKITFRVDAALRRALPTVAEFQGVVANRENIGLSIQEVIARWDEAHPDDPVERPPGMGRAA